MRRWQITLLIISLILLLVIVRTKIPEQKKQYTSTHFTFKYSKALQEALIFQLAEELEKNYTRLGLEYGLTPAEQIEVNIYSKRWRYVQATGLWGASGNIEGIDKIHYIENNTDQDDFGKIAVHELTHTIILKMLLDLEPTPLDKDGFDKRFAQFPVWLWEGISVYEANQFVEPSHLAYLGNGKYPEIKELNDRTKGQKIYSCGYTLIDYFLKEYGKAELLTLIRSYGDLASVIDVNEEQFSKDWYDYLVNNYSLDH